VVVYIKFRSIHTRSYVAADAAEAIDYNRPDAFPGRGYRREHTGNPASGDHNIDIIDNRHLFGGFSHELRQRFDSRPVQTHRRNHAANQNYKSASHNIPLYTNIPELNRNLTGLSRKPLNFR
jgi:hypothetical protein